MENATIRNCSSTWDFQKTLYNNVSDSEGVVNKVDDILVVGKGKTTEEAKKDLDKKNHEIIAKLSWTWNAAERRENESATNLSIFHGTHDQAYVLIGRR